MTHPRPKRQELTPGERADVLGKLGYTIRRTDTLGIYFVTRPDASRTYRVDVPAQTCNCQSTAWWGCKHLLYADHWFSYDRARQQLTEAYRRDLLVHQHEDSFYAAACALMAITGLDMWDEMRGVQRAAQWRPERIARAA